MTKLNNKRPLSNKTKFNFIIYSSFLLIALTIVIDAFVYLKKVIGKPTNNIQGSNPSTRVVDGDTIGILTEDKLRFACIDAPEKSQTLGEKSRAYLQGILQTEAEFSFHYYKTDNFGRKVSEIYLYNPESGKSINVNLLMVQQGYAVVEDAYGNCLNMGKYWEAQKEAKEAKRGIWGQEICFPQDYRKKECDF